MSSDDYYMGLALDLAKKGKRAVAPNPMVGAVIVKDGCIIAQGYHQRFGEAHAEVNAINSIKNKGDLKGATIYVTLEPCRHYGKTPPCSDLIKKMRIGRVVIGSTDPFQKSFSESDAQCSMEFLEGSVAKKCTELNKFFFTWVKKKRPYITVKVAVSADGFMAKSNGEPLKLTTHEQDVEVHQLRADHQAIMVSATTVINDDCHLGVRHVKGADPLRVIIDSKLRIPLNAKVLRDTNHLIVASKDADQNKIKLYKEKGVRIWICPIKGQVDLKKVFLYLGSQSISSLLIEPGPTFYGAIKKTGDIDDLIVYRSKVNFYEGLSWNE